MALCSSCNKPATHILVICYNIIGDGIFLLCNNHVDDDDKELCPCCHDYWIEFDGEDYLPTYPLGTLDGEGCCSEHP